MLEEKATPEPESEESATHISEQRAHTAVSYPAFGISSLALILIVFIGLFGYSIHERNVANQFAHENDQTSAALKDTRAQIDALNAKLNAVAAEQQPAQPAPVQHAAAVRTVVRHGKPDPRWKKLQTQLDAQGQKIDAQGKEIDATRQDLVTTRTDLTSSIAKTHDELVVLQRKGERNYYEFDLDKSKHFSHAGPVEVSLRKADTKHLYADLNLMVDDREVQKKHLNLYEPAMFYPGEDQQPLQVVINSITKNHIHGYISAPKYRASELAAMSGNATPAAAPADNASASSSPQLRPR
jgi:hypothetical protein